MTYQIDQSVRIEETNKDTIIGLADEKSLFTVCISAKIKRSIQEKFRRNGQPKQFMICVFTAGILIAIKKSNLSIHHILIDIEYPGYESKIQLYIEKILPNISVHFSAIGKKSPAHFAAYGVHIKKRKAAYVTNLVELEKLIQKMTESPKRA